MKLIFLGPPGAGKGTIASRVKETLGIPHISTGTIFRAAISAGSELGRKVKAVLDSGALVDDSLTSALVKERLAESDAQKGYILDGFPRTIAQAQALTGFAKIDKVVNFEIAEDAVIRRLSGRRVCPSCGAPYHIETLKPAKDGVCDACGTALITREDDKADTVKKRLSVYKAQTEPLIDFYKRAGLLASIDGDAPIDSVVQNCINILRG